MKLIDEDEYGAYLGVTADFLKEFILRETNPNFEVFDSRDNHSRFIAVKSSRLPDDQDLTEGRYGIDFHRAKPELQEALQYGNELPYTLESTKWLSNAAFAATTREEYDRKSSLWDDFYSYIWDLTPKTIWVTPHSGSVTRLPDDFFPYPKTVIDSFTAGVAALCAFKDKNKAVKKVMVSVHSSGFILTGLELGGFGILDKEKLNAIVKNIEMKYHERAQIIADEHKQNFYLVANGWLEYIMDERGTLNPKELNDVSTLDRQRVELITKGLRLYRQEIREFTLKEFQEAIYNLGKLEVQVISADYLFPGRKVNRQIGLSEKIEQGLLNSAIQFECSKAYLANEPELISDIILDIKNELFDRDYINS